MHEMLPGDPDAEVCAVKQGWDPRVQRTANTRFNQISYMILLLINVTVVLWVKVNDIWTK